MSNFMLGLQNLLTFNNLLMIFLGVFCGIIIGALPGLSATMGMVLALPLTYSMEPTAAMMLLLGLYCGGVYGGSITAVLINTPGTPAAAATVLDGYEFGKRGEGGRGIGIATMASFIGGIVSAIFLCVAAPQLADFALKFSAPDYFALALFGLTIIASISGKSVVKGLISGALGLLVATVGVDSMAGVTRFTFGSTHLLGGFSAVPVLIGLFAMPQVYMALEQGKAKERIIQTVKKVVPSKEDMKKIFPLSLIFGSVGTLIGAIPGTGATIASFLAYNEARRFSKHPEKFGTGIVEGVAAPESANNGVTGGALIPLLSLGIPGDVSTAVLIGAFMIQGLTPGPTLFTESPALVYSIFIALFVINTVVLVLGLFGIRLFTKIVSVPQYILTPMIFVFCVVGSYAINNQFFDVVSMLVFGLAGCAFTRLKVPAAPMVVGLILGTTVESNFRRALIMSKGSLSIFFTHPISLIFLICCVVSVFWPLLSKLFKKKSEVPASDDA